MSLLGAQRERSRADAVQHGPALASLIGAALLVAVFLIARLALWQPSSSDVFSDPDDYLRMALLPLADPRLWAGPRVFGIPLFFKLLQNNQPLIVVVQFGLATLAWLALAAAAARCVRSRLLALLTLGLVLAFSLSRDLLLWDLLLFSESLSMSVLALLLAGWLFLLESYRRGQVGRRETAVLLALIGGTLYWAFIRDTNAYAVLAAGGMILALLLLLRRARSHPHARLFAAAALLFGLSFSLSNWSADQGGRWQYPLMNVIGKRILTDDAATAFFTARGMPLDPLVRRFRDKYAHSNGNAVFRNPQMAYFREWLATRGKQTYTAYLAANPAETLAAPFVNRANLLRPGLGSYADDGAIRFPAWNLVLTGTLYTRETDALLLAAGALSTLALLLAGAGAGRLAWIVPLLLIGLSYPLALLTWHGDAIEVGRHSLVVSVMLRLGTGLLALLLLDRGLEWVGGKTRGDRHHKETKKRRSRRLKTVRTTYS